MDDEPELYIFRPTGGDEWRAERDRQQAESRRLQLVRMVDAMAFADACGGDLQTRAETLLDAFFVVRGVETGEPCSCSCHPRLPESDFHAYGADCSCRRTAEDRRRAWDEWQAENERYRNWTCYPPADSWRCGPEGTSTTNRIGGPRNSRREP